MKILTIIFLSLMDRAIFLFYFELVAPFLTISSWPLSIDLNTTSPYFSLLKTRCSFSIFYLLKQLVLHSSIVFCTNSKFYSRIALIQSSISSIVILLGRYLSKNYLNSFCVISLQFLYFKKEGDILISHVLDYFLRKLSLYSIRY